MVTQSRVRTAQSQEGYLGLCFQNEWRSQLGQIKKNPHIILYQFILIGLYSPNSRCSAQSLMFASTQDHSFMQRHYGNIPNCELGPKEL